MLDAIIELLPLDLVVEGIVVDFEHVPWNALRKSLPDVFVFGCWFHWAEAVHVNNRVKVYGLHSAYMQQMPDSTAQPSNFPYQHYY